MQRPITFLWMFIMMFAVNAADNSGDWKLRDWDAFYFTPEKKQSVRLYNPSVASGEKIKYEIRGYTDLVVARGESVVGKDHSLNIPFQLSRGYYEITLIGQQRKLRLWGGDQFTGVPDPFFGIDAGYSWFPGGAKEPAMMRALRNHGIHTVRERLSYRKVQDDVDAGKGWDGGQARYYLDVRRRLKAQNLGILDCFHDAPASRGGDPKSWNSGNYPVDLNSVGQDWKTFFAKLDGLDDSMEIWNEPDGFSAGPVTLYVPLAKTLAWSYAQSGAKINLVGGVFSELAPADFIETAARDGLFDYVDSVSYHTYSGPTEVEKQIRGYFDLFRKYHREGMPLLITEAGRPFSSDAWWEQGNAASWITAKAVAARACGVAGYYPFFAQVYSQSTGKTGRMDFSMLDSDSAPRRSMAAYLNMAGELSHLEYLGNLRSNDPLVLSCPVFGNSARMVAVPITLRVQAENRISIDAPITAIRGIDGRTLVPGNDRRIPVPDGVTYLELNPQQMKTKYAASLLHDTSYMELYRRARKPLQPKKVTPVVLGFRPEKADITCGERQLDGFHVGGEALSSFRFRINVFQLDATARKGKLVIVPPAGAVPAGEIVRELVLKPESSQAEEFLLDLSKCTGNSGTLGVRFEEDGRVFDAMYPELIWNTVRKTQRASSRGGMIRVDGKVSPGEWGSMEPVRLGDSEFNVTARFAWSPEGFFFAFEVRDPEHLQTTGPATAWLQDCIQMAFAGKGAQYEYGISLSNGKPQWSRWRAPSSVKPLSKNALLQIVRDEKSRMTVYEGMLPWGDLAPLKGEPNMSFGFTFCVGNLSADSGKTVLEWTPGIHRGGKNPDLFGTMNLYDNAE